MTASAQLSGTSEEEAALVQGTVGEERGASHAIRLSRDFYQGGGPWDQYPLRQSPPSLRARLLQACHCSWGRARGCVLNCLPLINVLRTYKPRQYVAGDLLAGLSSAFLHLPQGLGFGLLASLQPVHGLNTTFFSILVYLLFGTSPHVSMGTSAVVALLTAEVVEQQAIARGLLGLPGNETEAEDVTGNGTLPDALMEFKVGVAMAVTLMSGLMLLAMGMLRLGFLTTYMATSFVSGFTNAASVHIVTSQIPKMLHIRIPTFIGAGKLVHTWGAIITSLGQANVADVVISLVCLAVLLAVKVGVNERLKERLKVPVPVDLLLVIFCTLASHLGAFHARWGVSVVGPVPRGFPAPRLPDSSVMSSVAGPSFAIAVLIFVLTALLGNLCARKHGLQVDNSQEMVAYGLTNLASAFFPCFPSCTSPPRTMLLSALGARTTLHALPALLFMVLVLLVAGPLFQALPLAMLAAMIAVAMKDLLLQVRHLPLYWRVSKPDLAIWLVTWLAAALGDLDIGMAVGVVFSLLTVVVAGQGAEGQVVGVSSSEDLCLPCDRQGVRSPPGTRIFFFPTQLYFATAERFRRQLYVKVMDPTKVKQKSDADIAVTVNDGNTREAATQDSLADSCDVIRYVILDCSVMTYADVAGISTLKQVVTQYAEANVEVLLAACPPYLTQLLHSSKFFDSFPLEHSFHSVWDALHWLRAFSEQSDATSL